MAVTYGFYNSSNGDRKYSAEQISAIFDLLITEGVLSSVGDHFAVIPGNGRQILVKSGWAWFDSSWTYNDSTMPISLEPPDVIYDRIDIVVIETNKNLDVRANTIKVISGIASSTPQKPTLLNTTAIHQHPLAYVTVHPGATSIGTIDIENLAGRNECPFITSVLQSTSISVLFNQWEGEFDAWFNHIQEVLSEEVVTNLYAEIDKRVKISDKATTAEAQAGTNNTKWMTPALVKSAVEKQKYEIGDIRSTLLTLDANWLDITIGHENGITNQTLYDLTKGRHGVQFKSVLSFNPYTRNNITHISSWCEDPNTGRICVLGYNISSGNPTYNTPLCCWIISPTNQISFYTSTTVSTKHIFNSSITLSFFESGNFYFGVFVLPGGAYSSALIKVTPSGTITSIDMENSGTPISGLSSTCTVHRYSHFNNKLYTVIGYTAPYTGNTAGYGFINVTIYVYDLSTGTHTQKTITYTYYSAETVYRGEVSSVCIGGYVYLSLYTRNTSGSSSILTKRKEMIINLSNQTYEVGDNIIPPIINDILSLPNSTSQTILTANNSNPKNIFLDGKLVYTDSIPDKNVKVSYDEGYKSNNDSLDLYHNKYGFGIPRGIMYETNSTSVTLYSPFSGNANISDKYKLVSLSGIDGLNVGVYGFHGFGSFEFYIGNKTRLMLCTIKNQNPQTRQLYLLEENDQKFIPPVISDYKAYLKIL